MTCIPTVDDQVVQILEATLAYRPPLSRAVLIDTVEEALLLGESKSTRQKAISVVDNIIRKLHSEHGSLPDTQNAVLAEVAALVDGKARSLGKRQGKERGLLGHLADEIRMLRK